MVSYHCIK